MNETLSAYELFQLERYGNVLPEKEIEEFENNVGADILANSYQLELLKQEY